jgi:hypothetical protein
MNQAELETLQAHTSPELFKIFAEFHESFSARFKGLVNGTGSFDQIQMTTGALTALETVVNRLSANCCQRSAKEVLQK